MWAANDADAPKLTNTFYASSLAEKVGQTPDPEEAAMALHKAIKEFCRAKFPYINGCHSFTLVYR
jgi:hypothetical protein